MSVKLRTKPLSDGRLSLYLDIYSRGQRKLEWLNLYLTGNRQQDKQIEEIANKVRAEKELALASYKYDTTSHSFDGTNFGVRTLTGYVVSVDNSLIDDSTIKDMAYYIWQFFKTGKKKYSISLGLCRSRSIYSC